MYLQHLAPDFIEIVRPSDFGENFVSSLTWMTEKQYFGPKPYLPDNDANFGSDTDIDFTGFVSETLAFFKGSMHMRMRPDLSPASQMKSCKMHWQYKALHTKCNVAIG
jgi:hypothetical protein